VKRTSPPNVDEVIAAELGKVTSNGAFEEAERPETVSMTVMGAYVAPDGTVTTSWMLDAELTVALVAPK
jgi:hypothetical protein